MFTIQHDGTQLPGYFSDIASLLLLACVAAWIASAAFTARLAESKGYGSGLWFLGGLLFGVVALIAAAGMPSASVEQKLTEPDKSCPDCAARSLVEARICRYCRFQFPRDETARLLCKQLLRPDLAHPVEVAGHIERLFDSNVADHIAVIGCQASWYSLRRFVPILVSRGALGGATWLSDRFARVTDYEATEDIAATAGMVAAAGTEEAAKVLTPGLSRLRLFEDALVSIGRPATAAVTAVANGPDKAAAKAARRALARIEKDLASLEQAALGERPLRRRTLREGRVVSRFIARAHYLKENQPPALLLWGRHDPYCQLADVWSWLEALLRLQAHILDGTHMLLETHAEDAARLMSDFVARTRLSGHACIRAPPQCLAAPSIKKSGLAALASPRGGDRLSPRAEPQLGCSAKYKLATRPPCLR